MRKIKKTILSALEYRIQNPQSTLNGTARLFKVDRSSITLEKIEEFKTLKKENFFEDKRDANAIVYFSDDELDIIEYYSQHSNEPQSRLKEYFPDAPQIRTIRRWMDSLGREYHTGVARKYTYDTSKFKEILTEEDAYWLGFITADGCIIGDHALVINLAEKDKDHLRKFCYYLGLNNQLTEELIKNGFGGAYTRDNPTCRVTICSIEIVNNLKDKGITCRKSGKEKPYLCSSKELSLAYIRGLIDGDGFLGTTQERMGLVGSYEICDYFYKFINENIVDISRNHIREHGIIYKIELHDSQKVKIILKELYDNANIYLQRKYNIFIENYK